MARIRNGLVPIGEVFSDLDGPVKEISSARFRSVVDAPRLVRLRLIGHNER